MKNGFKKLLSVILCAVLLFTTASVAFAAEETRTVVDSGYCGAQGKNLTWTLYSDGELVISGEGEMDWYYINTKETSKFPQWYQYYGKIDIITVKEGVTSIGNQAFSLLPGEFCRYYKINLPQSLQFIESIFFNYNSNSRVPGHHLAYCYAGDESGWKQVMQRGVNLNMVKLENQNKYVPTKREYTYTRPIGVPDGKYEKLYFNSEEPQTFCELVKDATYNYDFIVHYYSADIRAEKILWYQVHNGKDKKVAQMNVGEYDVKEFLVTTTKSGQHYLRADVVDGDGNVIVSSEQVLIADVPEFGERIKLIFSDIKLLYAEVVYVLWLFVGLPIFGAVALPVLELLSLFGYKI